MRIGIDMSPAVHRRAGIGRYARELAHALVSLGGPHRFTAFYNRANQAAAEEIPPGMERWAVPDGDKPLRLRALMAHAANRAQDAGFPGLDLFHATDNLLPRLRGVRTVFTLHDLSFLTTDTASFANWLYLRLAMGWYLRRADAIITVSEATRAEAVRHYKVRADRMTTIYPGVAPWFVPQPAEKSVQVRSKYGLPERFLLFVGTIEPRKNLAFLLDVFQGVRARSGKDVGLVLVGRTGWRSEGFFSHLHSLGLGDSVRLTGFVPDEELPALYGAAAALAFPSVCEGFGSPVVEAMACGTPVIASSVSSLPEVLGDAGIFADPTRGREWVEGIHRVLTDRTYAESLREKGRKRAAAFTWERAARETLAVYERAGAVRPS